MNHPDERELLLHLDTDPGARPDDAAALQAHLASCAECRARMDSLRRVIELAREAPVPVFHNLFLILSSALFSNRETCAWLMPTSFETSI